MSDSMHRRYAIVFICALWGLAVAITGCGGGASMQWIKNGFIDPTQVGQFAEPRRNEIRGTLGILEEPEGILGAEAPTEEDLNAVYADPVIGSGDVLDISIFELVTPGVATDIRVLVSNSGFETIPVLGRVRLAGFTPRELELDLKQRLREVEILEDADVRVSPVQLQSQQFSVVGFAGRPGAYPITRPDFRLLDAIAVIQGIPEQVEKIYIMRRTPTTDGESSARMDDVGYRSPHDVGSASTPFTMSDASIGPAGATSTPSGQATRPAGGVSVDELQILEGGPSGPAPVPDWDPQKQEWVFRSSTQPTSAAAAPAVREHDGQPPEPTVDDTEAPLPLGPPMRIIEIPLKDLMAHDPRFNVVIRPYDVINVPPIQQSEYYLSGHVARPGAYRFPGRPLTVKEAVTSAGGFDALAWPSRADLIRRVNPFEEQIIQVDLDAIFAGTAPDFYMKPNDILNVGTTAVAPFLAVIRNSFRMSYGFGFVYDRNFADKEGFFAEEQRKNRRRIEAQARGIPF